MNTTFSLNHAAPPAQEYMSEAATAATHAGADSCIDALLRNAPMYVDTTCWAWYQAGEDLHLTAQGDVADAWPATLTADDFHTFCKSRRLCLWPTGSGENILGWLLAPAALAANPVLTDFARSLGEALQTDTLARAQNTQRVLYEIAYLASSVRECSEFLLGVHRQLATLIDAENFYLALYDPSNNGITYPYYVDVIDTHALDPAAYDTLDFSCLSLTGQVLTTGQPLLIDAAGICAAEDEGRFYCVGDRPEFWMGAPLKNASDEVFGMIAMQVYDVSRVYSVEDRALFLVVARHVAMALDRILHRAGLEETVSRRTAELSELNRTLRLEIAERKRAEHLQGALFQIAELSSRHGDMMEFFRSLHGIVGELLYAKNFYIALVDCEADTVSFPYYVDELQSADPAPRRGRRGLTEYVIRERRPCLIDLAEATRLANAGEIEVAGESIKLRSWLGIPLFDGDVVRGVLAVQSYSLGVVTRCATRNC